MTRYHGTCSGQSEHCVITKTVCTGKKKEHIAKSTPLHVVLISVIQSLMVNTKRSKSYRVTFVLPNNYRNSIVIVFDNHIRYRHIIFLLY